MTTDKTPDVQPESGPDQLSKAMNGLLRELGKGFAVGEVPKMAFESRPTWISFVVREPVLLVSLEHARETLGDDEANMLIGAFQMGAGDRGIWAIPHPDAVGAVYAPDEPAEEKPAEEPASRLHHRLRNRVHAFLYLLARDHLPTGTVMGVIQNYMPPDNAVFSSPGLAEWAAEALENLEEGPRSTGRHP